MITGARILSVKLTVSFLAERIKEV